MTGDARRARSARIAGLPALLLASFVAASVAGAQPAGGLDAPPPASEPISLFQPAAAPEAPAPRGNPLWALPVDRLAATRERPLFSPSRRPPPAAAVAEPQAALPDAAADAGPAAAAQPSLDLIGTVVNGEDGIGIFLDRATSAVMRLRVGEEHEGWVLRTVGLRDATLELDATSAVLSLPPRDSAPPPTAEPPPRPAVTPRNEPDPSGH